jgi:hypothetical protein
VVGVGRVVGPRARRLVGWGLGLGVDGDVDVDWGLSGCFLFLFLIPLLVWVGGWYFRNDVLLVSRDVF